MEDTGEVTGQARLVNKSMDGRGSNVSVIDCTWP